jgi:phospholipid-binding lipoprotein MlaA
MASRSLSGLAVLLAAWCSSGCAATLEKTNRVVYWANETVDEGVFQPITKLYLGVVPRPVRTMVSNFVDNLSYLDTVLNDFLQGKAKQGGEDLGRFLANTTLGVVGLFDIATELGLEEHDEDFGQTLGVWGLPSGPYLVLPLFGPSTVRDVPGIIVTSVTTPVVLLRPVVLLSESALVVPVQAVSAVDLRARAQGDLEARDASAIDPYVFTKEAYMQRRAFLVHDGRVPEEDSKREFESLLDDLDG